MAARARFVEEEALKREIVPIPGAIRIAYLKLKQAYALNRGESENASLAAEAERSFLENHLAIMVAPLVRSLEAAAPPYLVLAGRVLRARVGENLRRPKPTT